MKSIKPALIELRKLMITDLADLIELWNNDLHDYNQYFIPFDFTNSKLESILSKAVNDLYIGIFIDKKIAGFFMLRGFDEGFEIPSYGVWISSKFANKGLGKLTLVYAISICRVSDIKKIMLKVHPENKIAFNMYKKYGFTVTVIDEKIGHVIMHKDLF